MMQTIIVIVALIALPLVLFFSVVGLAIFIWCWNRIGRYFINFGRWVGSWRNFIPLSIIGFLSLILILVILPILGLPRVLIVIQLVVFLLVTILIFLFAFIAWTLWFCQWFWPRWRKLVWSWILSIWGVLPARGDGGRRTRSKPPPEKRTPARKEPARRPSGFSSFWTLLLGKPTQPAKPSGTVEAAPIATVQPPKKKVPPRTSWFGSFWALMLGKPSKPTGTRSRHTKVRATEQSLGPSGSAAVAAKTGATAGIAEPTTTRESEKREKPAKRGFLSNIWTSIVRCVTLVVEKIREGIEWIRIKLNLD